jgi:hypothetical protein
MTRIFRSFLEHFSGLYGWPEMDSYYRLVGFFQRDALGIETFETKFSSR